jgi:hypothetical protein
LIVLFESFVKGRLADSWGAPSLELNVFGIVQPMGEQDRGEVNIRKVATSKIVCAIAGEGFDPLCTSGEVVFWIVRVGMSMSTAHRDRDKDKASGARVGLSGANSQKATAMKRPSSSSSAPSKKQKGSPHVSDSEIVLPEGDPADAQWEKVERRKSKKQKKIDAKLDVCVSISSPV